MQKSAHDLIKGKLTVTKVFPQCKLYNLPWNKTNLILERKSSQRNKVRERNKVKAQSNKQTNRQTNRQTNKQTERKQITNTWTE